MTRFHLTAFGKVPFSAQEEADADQRQAAIEAGEVQRQKDAANAEIIRKLEAIDRKRIRPLAEGDAEILADLNAQAVALRSQLVK